MSHLIFGNDYKKMNINYGIIKIQLELSLKKVLLMRGILQNGILQCIYIIEENDFTL